eukprot:TRINITY_DN59128_c0_g1_i1.p1 TRINITY_DN59128_c0_g1~~TRINITY_DN59128_c0_g1_i1.p1  ORF type:complete len:984 (+),score=318.60 TRINITY_DN59128_c0_g1_i1:148-3099(+)
MSNCAEYLSLSTYLGDHEGAWSSELIYRSLVPAGVGVVWVFGTSAALLAGEGPTLAASLGMYLITCLVILLFAITLVTREVTQRIVESAGTLSVILLVLLDWGLACGTHGLESWPICLVVTVGMSAMGARELISLSCLGVATVWVMVRTAEDAFQFGLFSVTEQHLEYPRGWAAFFVSIGIRLLPVAMCIPIDYIVSVQRFRSLSLETLRATEGVVRELTSFNLDAAKELLDAMFEEEEEDFRTLREAFFRLCHVLALYKPYLPQTVVLMDQPGSDDEVVMNPAFEGIQVHPLVGNSRQEDSMSRSSGYETVAPIADDATDHGRLPLPHLLRTPGHFQPRTATLMLVTVEYDLAQCINGPEGQVNTFLTRVMEKSKAFDGVTLHMEATRVLVSWNSHKPHHQHSLAACRCAFALDGALGAVLPEQYSIAIARDKYFVGSAGIKEQMASVVVGKTAFLTGLAALARQIDVRVLMTDSVCDTVPTSVEARPVDSVKESGSNKTVDVYELLDVDSGSTDPPLLRTVPYVCAYSLLRTLRLTECLKKLVEHLSIAEHDDQALRLRRIVDWLRASPDKHPAYKNVGYHRTTQKYWEDFEGCAAELVPESEPEEAKDVEYLSDSSDSVIDGRGRPRSVGSGRSGRSRAGSHASGRGIAPTQSTVSMLQQQMMSQSSRRRAPSQPGGQIGDTTPKGSLLKEIFADTSDTTWFRSNKRLGKGQYGEVWLAMGVTGSLVAVKVMELPSVAAATASERGGRRHRGQRKREVNAQEQQELILKEVGLLETLRHDNIVGYIGSCAMDGYVFIVMENLSGGSLDTVLKAFSSLPLLSIKRYVRDIIRGLAFLHENKIIHRDLKPHNVLMTNEGECKLADFGTAHFFADSPEISTDHNNKGTALYMPPESLNSREAVPATDVWSLGILICELFTGDVPYQYQGMMPEAFRWQLSEGEIAPKIPDVPENAKDLIKSCLVRDPDERPSSLELASHIFVI